MKLAGICLIFCFMAAGCGAGQDGRASEAGEETARINEYTVTQEAYNFFYDMNKARAASDFYSEYGIDVSGADADWDTENEEGISASEYAEELTVQAITRYAAVWTCARERGLETLDGYSGLKEKLEEVNSSGSGVTGYGMTKWTEENLFMYLYQDLESRLLKEVGENEFEFSEAELRAHYEEMDKDSLALRGELRARINVWYCADESAADLPEVKQYLGTVYEALTGGDEAPAPAGDLGIERLQDHEIGTGMTGLDDMFGQAVLTELFRHQEGDVFQGVYSGLPTVVQVLSAEKTGGDFEPSVPAGRNALIQRKYGEMIEDKMDKVSINWELD